MKPMIAVLICGTILFAGCTSPEEKVLKHLESVVKLLEKNCEGGAKGKCSAPDKAAKDIKAYHKLHETELADIKRQLEEKEQKLAKDPKALKEWEDTYRDKVDKLTGRIAKLMKAYPNLRSNKNVKESLNIFK